MNVTVCVCGDSRMAKNRVEESWGCPGNKSLKAKQVGEEMEAEEGGEWRPHRLQNSNEQSPTLLPESHLGTSPQKHRSAQHYKFPFGCCSLVSRVCLTGSSFT